MTDYKKYSLGQLENFLYDAMGAAEATPQEIYDVIKSAVEDNYYTYKKQASDAYELLALLNCNGQSYEDVMKEKEYYEPSMPPWGHSDMEALKYTDEELDKMCDTAEAKDKVVRWILPVEADGPSGEYFITFPDDLLDASNLKEGDEVEWYDQGDGSYLIKRVEKKEDSFLVEGNELPKVKTYQELIDDGCELTADGFWIKEQY